MMRGVPHRQLDARTLEHADPQWVHRVASRPGKRSGLTIALVGPSRASLAVTAGSLIYEIRQMGHSAICFAPELKDIAASDALSRLSAELHELPAFRQGFSPIADQRGIIRLARSFLKLKPDIVAGYTPKGAALAALAGRIARVPHIVSMINELGRGFEEMPDRTFLLNTQLQKTLLRFAFKLSHTAIFFNEENYKLLQRQNLLADRLRQFPTNGSGIDLRQFPAPSLPPLDRGVMFLYASPLDRRFGIAEFCKAARHLRTKPGRYKCLVVGPEVDGPNGFPLALLKRYRDVIQYLGPHADPRPFMAGTHVFVLPARGDAIPQALIEAVAMGRPVITSTSRGCRMAVREGANGMIVPAGDATALAGAMSRLLLRPDLIPSMARASRELAESRFDNRKISGVLRAALDL